MAKVFETVLAADIQKNFYWATVKIRRIDIVLTTPLNSSQNANEEDDDKGLNLKVEDLLETIVL